MVYHVSCFSCFSCRSPLRSGEHFLIKDNELYCRPECFAASTTAVQCKQESCGVISSTNVWGESVDPSRDLKPMASPQSSKSPEIISSSSTPNSLCMPLMPPQFVPSMPVNGHNRSSISSSSNNSLGSMSTKKSKKDKPVSRFERQGFHNAKLPMISVNPCPNSFK